MRNFIVTATFIILVTAAFVLFDTIIETGGTLRQFVAVVSVVVGAGIAPAFYKFD